MSFQVWKANLSFRCKKPPTKLSDLFRHPPCFCFLRLHQEASQRGSEKGGIASRGWGQGWDKERTTDASKEGTQKQKLQNQLGILLYLHRPPLAHMALTYFTDVLGGVSNQVAAGLPGLLLWELTRLICLFFFSPNAYFPSTLSPKQCCRA